MSLRIIPRVHREQPSRPTMLTATICAGPAGIDMGTFTGSDEAGILDAYAREQGYADFDALADALDLERQKARDELRVEYLDDDAGFAARDQAATRKLAADYKAGRPPFYADDPTRQR